jgi:WD40 repeat protein
MSPWPATSGCYQERSESIADGKDAARFIAFDPTGERVVVTSFDHTAKVWNLASGGEVRLVGHEGPVVYAAFSPNGNLVATASTDGTVRIWLADTGARIASLKGHRAAVNDVEFDHDGKNIVSSSDDRTAKIWNVEHRGLLTTCRQGAEVGFARFSPDTRSKAGLKGRQPRA